MRRAAHSRERAGDHASLDEQDGWNQHEARSDAHGLVHFHLGARPARQWRAGAGRDRLAGDPAGPGRAGTGARRLPPPPRVHRRRGSARPALGCDRAPLPSRAPGADGDLCRARASPGRQHHLDRRGARAPGTPDHHHLWADRPLRRAHGRCGRSGHPAERRPGDLDQRPRGCGPRPGRRRGSRRRPRTLRPAQGSLSRAARIDHRVRGRTGCRGGQRHDAAPSGARGTRPPHPLHDRPQGEARHRSRGPARQPDRDHQPELRRQRRAPPAAAGRRDRDRLPRQELELRRPLRAHRRQPPDDGGRARAARSLRRRRRGAVAALRLGDAAGLRRGLDLGLRRQPGRVVERVRLLGGERRRERRQVLRRRHLRARDRAQPRRDARSSERRRRPRRLSLRLRLRRARQVRYGHELHLPAPPPLRRSACDLQRSVLRSRRERGRLGQRLARARARPRRRGRVPAVDPPRLRVRHRRPCDPRHHGGRSRRERGRRRRTKTARRL